MAFCFVWFGFFYLLLLWVFLWGSFFWFCFVFLMFFFNSNLNATKNSQPLQACFPCIELTMTFNRYISLISLVKEHLQCFPRTDIICHNYSQQSQNKIKAMSRLCPPTCAVGDNVNPLKSSILTKSAERDTYVSFRPFMWRR